MVPAFCPVTGDYTLIEMTAFACGCLVVQSKDAFLLRMGLPDAQAEELAFDIVTGRASAADVARFDVAGGVAGAVPAAASSVASTKKEA